MSETLERRYQSRKFLLALLTLVAGTALVLADRLTDAWVDLALFVNTIYGAANIAGHTLPRVIGKQEPPND